MDKPLYRFDEVARMLSCTVRTIRNKIDEGLLDEHNPKPGRKGGRVTKESLDRYLKKHVVTVQNGIK